MYIPGMVIFGRKRIAELEARIAKLETLVRPSDLEVLAQEIQKAIPAISNETTGVVDHSSRIKEAFKLAREWIAERDRP
jgi:predicted TIM-barrel fold metal-dependent hydrolase